MIDILNKITKLKNERGWSTYKLADEAGITQSTLANMFSRKTMPSIQTLNSICTAFGISLSEFFSEDEKEIKEFSNNQLMVEYNKLNAKNKSIVKKIIHELQGTE